MGKELNIEGASSSSYTIQSTDMSMNGRYYYCIVTSGRSQIESARAKLTIVAKDEGGTKPSTGSGTNPGTGSGTNFGSTTKPSTKLPAPKLTVRLSSANAVKLSWNKVSGATGYYIYRATSSKGKYTKIGTTKKTSYKEFKAKEQ